MSKAARRRHRAQELRDQVKHIHDDLNDVSNSQSRLKSLEVLVNALGLLVTDMHWALVGYWNTHQSMYGFSPPYVSQYGTDDWPIGPTSGNDEPTANEETVASQKVNEAIVMAKAKTQLVHDGSMPLRTSTYAEDLISPSADAYEHIRIDPIAKDSPSEHSCIQYGPSYHISSPTQVNNEAIVTAEVKASGLCDVPSSGPASSSSGVITFPNPEAGEYDPIESIANPFLSEDSSVFQSGKLLNKDALVMGETVKAQENNDAIVTADGLLSLVQDGLSSLPCSRPSSSVLTEVYEYDPTELIAKLDSSVAMTVARQWRVPKFCKPYSLAHSIWNDETQFNVIGEIVQKLEQQPYPASLLLGFWQRIHSHIQAQLRERLSSMLYWKCCTPNGVFECDVLARIWCPFESFEPCFIDPEEDDYIGDPDYAMSD